MHLLLAKDGASLDSFSFHLPTPHSSPSWDSLTPLCQAICCGPNIHLGHRPFPLAMPMGNGCPSLGIYGLCAQQALPCSWGSAGSSLHFLWASPDLTPCVEDRGHYPKGLQEECVTSAYLHSYLLHVFGKGLKNAKVLPLRSPNPWFHCSSWGFFPQPCRVVLCHLSG